MRTIRVHVDQPLVVGQELVLPEDALRHLGTVLRLGPGDTFVLFNGDGHDYLARWVAGARKGARAAVLAREPVDRESPLQITLAQALCRGEKMDLVLQKATELGVRAVQLLHSARSEVKLDGERLPARMQHWRRVIVAACEQCGRALVPDLHPPQPLALWLQQRISGLRLHLDPQAQASLASLPAVDAVTLLVGPEGGLAPEELERLEASGSTGLRLGPRVLRSETAGLAAIAALQARCGDMG
jgi:16S rRNA (uracil1498-N3)-methyltransferase